jgi:membrane fusion protein (multidrug efflux system)
MQDVAEHKTEQKNESKPERHIPKKRLKWIAVLAVLAGILGTAYWWFFMRNRVSTDDAYVHADSAQISSRINGTVLQILVENDYAVEEGQTLVELDPATYRVVVESARALLAKAEADVQAAELMVPQVGIQTASQVQTAEAALKAAHDQKRESLNRLSQLESNRSAALAQFTLARRNYDRYEKLFRTGAVAKERRDEASATFKQAKAGLDAVDAQIAATKAVLAGVEQKINQTEAELKTARGNLVNTDIQRYKLASLKAKRDQYKADLDSAELNLSYCTIAAPISGYIAQKWVQAGDRIQPAQALMAVVPLQDAYIEANYKETQLTHVRLGQPAKIVADIYPDHTFYGKVVGIGAGTGAAFSLLPPQNATGNWIKIVQRIPVKIFLNKPQPPDRPLRVGLSLTVTINTANRSGPALLPPGPAGLISPQ